MFCFLSGCQQTDIIVDKGVTSQKPGTQFEQAFLEAIMADANVHWQSGSQNVPEMIWIEFENPTIVTEVSFGSREDDPSYASLDGPSKFELLGTNDSIFAMQCNANSVWITIASDMSGSPFTFKGIKKLEVPSKNLQPFKGYGIRILEVPGRSDGKKWVTISSLHFKVPSL
jgi:hypothetical protein